MWHKEVCDLNGCDYKKGFLLLNNYYMKVNFNMNATPSIIRLKVSSFSLFLTILFDPLLKGPLGCEASFVVIEEIIYN